MEKEPMKVSKSTAALAVGITAFILVAVVGIGAALYFNSDSYHMKDIKKDIAQAEENYEEYQKIHFYVQNGIDETGNSELTDFKAQIYLEEIENYRILSDHYLEEGDCVSAVQTLMDGAADIGADTLAERAAYLRENIICVRETVTTKETAYKFGEITVYEYDKAGNESKCTNYFSDGRIESCCEYEYDETGNKTKCVAYNSDGEINHLTEWEYDESGNQIVTSTNYQYGNVISYWYNKSGNVIKNINYAPDGSIILCDEYDGAGNLVKAARYEDGVLYQWKESEYDEAGNRIKGIWYYYGNITSWDEYEYNEEGKMIKEIWHDNYYRDSWYEYQYNEAGNLIWKTHYILDGDMGRRMNEEEYDEAGRKIRSISYKANGEMCDKVKWEYDEEGNKTKHTLYNEDGSRTEWEFNKEGRTVKETNYNLHGQLRDVKEEKYNIFGNVITDLDGNTYRYEYIYNGE